MIRDNFTSKRVSMDLEVLNTVRLKICIRLGRIKYLICEVNSYKVKIRIPTEICDIQSVVLVV